MLHTKTPKEARALATAARTIFSLLGGLGVLLVL